MNKIVDLIFVAIILAISTSALPSLPEIDATLSKVNQDLTYFQTNLQNKNNELATEAQNLIDNLKNRTLAPNLVLQLESLRNLLQRLETIDYFEVYENISTCADVNYKITMMEIDVQLYFDIIGKTNFNVSILYGIYAQANLQYAINVASLSSLSSNVSTCLRNTVLLFTEYAKFNGLLAQQINIVTSTKFILNAYKKSYCTCLSSASISGINSTLERNVNIIERNLKIFETNIRNFSNQTLTLIATALKSTTGTMTTNLQSLRTLLTRVLTISDYSNAKLSNLSNCNALYTRIQYLRAKQVSYSSTFVSSHSNFSLIIGNRLRVNMSASGSQISITNVINSTMRIENNLRVYAQKLTQAVQKMATMISEMMSVGDTFCSCEIKTTSGGVTTTSAAASTTTSSTSTSTTTESPSTTSTTSTTIPTTSTTSTTMTTTTASLMPCGTFVKYDTVNGVNDPQLYGVSAGTFHDGTTVYIGYSDNSACFNQSNCPSRISTNSSGPGGYATCYDVLDEVYDSKNAFYLLNHPNLAFVPANASSILTISGIIQNNAGGFSMAYGRTFYETYTTTCKVLIDSQGKGGNGCYFYTPIQEVSIETGFDVLVCNP